MEWGTTKILEVISCKQHHISLSEDAECLSCNVQRGSLEV